MALYSSATCTFLLSSGTNPGPVSNLEATAPDARTMNLTWDATGFIDRFEIAYNYTINGCSEIGDHLGDTSNGSVRSYTLIDLSEDSRYTITVTAINTAGSTNDTIVVDTPTSGEAIIIIRTDYESMM